MGRSLLCARTCREDRTAFERSRSEASWKKVTSSSERRIRDALPRPGGTPSGESGESPEIADEMGLVVIAAIQGHIRPREPLSRLGPVPGPPGSGDPAVHLGVSPTSSVKRRMNVLGLRPTCRITSPTVFAMWPAPGTLPARTRRRDAVPGAGRPAPAAPVRGHRTWPSASSLRAAARAMHRLGVPQSASRGTWALCNSLAGRSRNGKAPPGLKRMPTDKASPEGSTAKASEWAPKSEGPGESSRRSMTSPMVPVGSTRSLTRTEASHR